MNYLNTEDIIVAQCTSEGHGAINIIRISGDSLAELYLKTVKQNSPPKPNSILYKSIYINDEKIDDAMISFFKGPKSFTGEDIIEINCHGGDFISKKIIKKLTKMKNIRHALPGEFSFRAYYNGKIDVIQAESINGLIKSQTNLHANKSMENIDGQLSTEIKRIRKKIIKISSFCEYGLDIDENDDKAIVMQIGDMIKEIGVLVDNILSCNLYSKVIEKGIRVALFGRPNVGKSTLFNSLLGFDRSIVSSLSGTTRDVIEASVEINGHLVRLIDTAGYRNTGDQIEALGINKTRKEIDKADILICLGENEEDLLMFSELVVKKNIIKVLSKCDINKCSGFDLEISSISCQGFKKLLTELSTRVHGLTSGKSVNSEYYINDRQQEVLIRVLNKADSLKKKLNTGVSLDIISEYVKEMVDEIDEIVSPIGREEIIDNIFSNFCVGK